VFERLAGLEEEYEEVLRRLSDPSAAADQATFRQLSRRHKQLEGIVSVYRRYLRAAEDLAVAKDLYGDAGADDRELLRSEIDAAETTMATLEEELRVLLLPRDPNDDKNVIVEIRGAEGGEEANLFARDLFEMYSRYAERRGWKLEILGSAPSDMGGFNEVSFLVKGDGVWSRMKHEAGVHRVQRVPVTESQGRIHTSAAGVLVMPEADPIEVTIDPNDLRVDTFHSSGPGGQSVNTTDSAVRITHKPTGIVVSCQNEKSQLQNREQALRILRARLLAQAQEEADAQAAAERRSQVAAVDRSQRVRTYNFPENRISDHRVGYKAYNLDHVIDGDLDAVIGALEAADRAEKIAESAERAS